MPIYDVAGTKTYTDNEPTRASKTPELETALATLEKILCELGENVDGLEARLDSVLLPLNSDGTKDAVAIGEQHSKIVSCVYVVCGRLELINKRLSSIKSRLEV